MTTETWTGGRADDLTPMEVACRLRISERSVRALCVSRALGAYRIGKLWRIPLGEVDIYRARQMTAARGGT